MTSSLKLVKFALLSMPIFISLACSDFESVSKFETSRDSLQLDKQLALADINRSETDDYYKVPPKPPIPKGVSVAVDCWPIASRYETHSEYLLDRGWCGRQNPDGWIQIDKEVTDLLDFSQPAPARSRHSKDLKCLFISLSSKKSGYAYVRSDGRVRFADFPYDNSCQPFGNGVFVEYLDGFVVYTDENFNPVKYTDYVLADGFNNYLSKVCRVKPEKQYDIGGEHFEWLGGQCGYIGIDFKVVEPIIHTYENTPRPKGGKYDGDEPTGIEARMVEVLTLELPNNERLEAVFLKGGCAFQSDYVKCDEEYTGLPEALYKKGHHIREIHLRVENQSYYRGLVVFSGGRGLKERELVWHSVEPIETPILD